MGFQQRSDSRSRKAEMREYISYIDVHAPRAKMFAKDIHEYLDQIPVSNASESLHFENCLFSIISRVRDTRNYAILLQRRYNLNADYSTVQSSLRSYAMDFSENREKVMNWICYLVDQIARFLGGNDSSFVNFQSNLNNPPLKNVDGIKAMSFS